MNSLEKLRLKIFANFPGSSKMQILSPILKYPLFGRGMISPHLTSCCKETIDYCLSGQLCYFFY